MQQCQLLRQAITVWRNPGTCCYDVSLMFTTALKIASKPCIQILEIGHNQGKCTLFYYCFDHYRTLEFKIAASEVYMILENTYIKTPITNRQVEDWEASNGQTKYTIRLFHGPWHDPVGKYICAQSFRMWNRLRFYPFLQVSQIFQRHKNDANRGDFEKSFIWHVKLNQPS